MRRVGRDDPYRRRAQIDHEKFGVLVAKNFGASSDVFASEADALAWLRGKG